MKNLSICALLVILGACGAKSSKNNDKQKEDQAHCLCMAQTNYQLTSPQAFPEKMRITLNSENIENLVLLDECSRDEFSGTDYKIQRLADSGIIEGKFYAAVRGNLEVEITDLGSDCSNDGIFYSNDNVTKEITVLNDNPAKPRLENLVIKL